MSDFENIPDELKERDQWLYWNASNDTPRAPLDSPAATYACSWSDPDEWLSFDDVSENAAAVEKAGIGYVNAAENDDFARGIYAVIDLDGVADAKGSPKDWLPSLQPFFDRNAYVEWSPSGDGLHIPVVGIDVPEWWSDQHFSDDEHEGVEVLAHKFSTFTGEQLDGAGDTVVEYGEWLDDWLREAYKAVTGDDPLGGRADEIADDVTPDTGSSGTSEEWFDADAAEEALKHIDPDLPRNDWRDVGMALKNAFGARGERLFKNWSRGGTKWDSDAEEQAERILDDASDWNYDRGTIINFAQNGGWDASAAAKQRLSSVPDEHDLEPVDDPSGNVSERGEARDKADEQSIVNTSELVAYRGGYGYMRTDENGDEWFDRITNFELDVESFLFKDGERLIDMCVEPSTGEEAYDVTVPASVFNDARRFRDNVVTGLTTTYEGSPSDLNELRKLVGGQSAPIRQGTHHMGLHIDSGEFVTPGGVLTADGWSDDPTMSYMEREIAAERAFELAPDTHDGYDRDEVAEILELLPQTRNSERFLPVLGWLYTAPLRPLVQQWEGQFNTLHVTGETGAGKSSTLSIAWQLLGMDGDPMACDDTKFALTTAMASTNSVPMWFDEYKPGDMKDWELDRFQTLMRKSTRGGVETRGNADKSTEEYRLKAPLMISGEQAVQGAAEERRSIQTRFLDDVKDPGSATREAFGKLTGTAYTVDGETVEPAGYDLQQHALAYYRFVLQQDHERLYEQWRRSREHVRDLLTTHGITGVDDLPRQGIQTIHFGLSLFARFGTEIGASGLPTPDEIDTALLYIARQFGDKGSRKSHLDRFVELTARAAAEEYIEDGEHYTVVNEGTPEEEIALKLNRTFDAVSKYARDYALDGEDMLNTAKDYRERIKEAAEKSRSYINEASQYTTGLNRCVRVDTTTVTEALDIDAESFGATPQTDEDAENGPEEAGTGGSNPTLGTLEPGRYSGKTIEATVAEKMGEPKPYLQAEGALVDDGEILDFEARGDTNPLSVVAEGDRVRITHPKVTEQNGVLTLEVSGVCDVEVVATPDDGQATVDESATSTAATDGSGDYEQLKPRVLDAVDKGYGTGAKVTVAAIAGELGAQPDSVADALETIADEKTLLERTDDAYRRL